LSYRSNRLGQECHRENDAAIEIAAVRARLDHPIIDSDGHTFELPPLFTDYLKSVAGAKVVERFQTAYFDTFADPRWSRFSVQERRERRNLRPTWWAIPARKYH